MTDDREQMIEGIVISYSLLVIGFDKVSGISPIAAECQVLSSVRKKHTFGLKLTTS